MDTDSTDNADNSGDEGKPDDKNKREEPLTEETFNARLQAYHDAYQAEYRLAEDVGNTEGRDSEEITRNFYKDHVPVAAAQIVHLMQNSTSDSVRLAASKYVAEQAFKSEQESGDPIAKLIAEMKKKNKPAPVGNDG